MSPVQYLLAALFLACGAMSVLLVWREVQAWRRRQGVPWAAQLVLRVVGGVLLLGLSAKLLYGTFHVYYTVQSRRVQLLYWTDCVGLALVVALVAMVDLIYVWRWRRWQRRLMRAQARARLEAELRELAATIAAAKQASDGERPE